MKSYHAEKLNWDLVREYSSKKSGAVKKEKYLRFSKDTKGITHSNLFNCCMVYDFCMIGINNSLICTIFKNWYGKTFT